MVSRAGGYSHIAFPATTSGKNVAPRVGALLDAMVFSEIIEIVSADAFEGPIHAGNAIQTVRSSDPVTDVTREVMKYDVVIVAPGPPACRR